VKRWQNSATYNCARTHRPEISNLRYSHRLFTKQVIGTQQNSWRVTLASAAAHDLLFLPNATSFSVVFAASAGTFVKRFRIWILRVAMPKLHKIPN
jgi:hypothetical protein